MEHTGGHGEQVTGNAAGMLHDMGMAEGHKDAFHLGHKLTVLTEYIKVDSGLGIALVTVVFIIVTMCYEGLRCLRMHLAAKYGYGDKRITITSKGHIIQTGLYFSEFVFSYAIMLMVMTYNAWMLIAVVIGSTIGFQLCRLLSKSHDDPLDEEETDDTEEKGDKTAPCPKKAAAAAGKINADKSVDTHAEEIESLVSSV